MPLSAELRVPSDGKFLELLAQCQGLKLAIQDAVPWEGKLRIHALRLLLLQDVYGDQYEQTDEDRDLWSTSLCPLWAEQDLIEPRIVGFIGKWNISFLRWLKAVSLSTGEACSIHYDHERGDTPYEYVWWSSDPQCTHGGSETFGLSSHGGMDEPEWEWQAVRDASGHTEIHEAGSCGDSPLYLS